MGLLLMLRWQILDSLRQSCHVATRNWSQPVRAWTVRESAVDGVRAEQLPTFSVSAGAFANNDQSDDTQASLNARLPLVTFGRQEASERVSAARLALAEPEYFQSVAEHIEKLVGLWAYA
jgi:hypothetical protein